MVILIYSYRKENILYLVILKNKAFHILIVKSPVGFYTINRFSVHMRYTYNMFIFFFYYNVHTQYISTRSCKNDLMFLKRQTVFYGTPKHAAAAYTGYTKNFVFV